MQAYVDTGALVALVAADDRYHREAEQFFRRSLVKGTRFVIGRPVLIEYLDGLTKRVSKGKALQELRRIDASAVMRIEDEEDEDWARARELFERYDDQPIDMTDSISFAIMERLDLRQVFGFDRDFDVHGFTRVPETKA